MKTVELKEINAEIAYKRIRMGNEYIASNKLAGDGENNLVIYDYPYSSEIDSKNFSEHLLMGIETRHLQHVIACGRMLVENRKLTSINEDDIWMQVRDITRQLIKRL